ncbi:MAG: AsmA family protein [Candidatus Acidiferrales bacterium]
MKRWTKILLAIVALVVAATASLPLFVNANTFRPVIEKQLSSAFGRSVKFGDLSLPPFSGSLVAKDLSVAGDPAFSDATFLTAKELRISVSLRRLIFSHELQLRGFEIESPQINLVRAASGAWNFSTIGHQIPAAAGPPPASAGAAPQHPKSPVPALADLSVALIVIENGRATFTSLPAEGPPTIYDGVNLTARNFSLSAQFPFELSANLPAGGTISVTGKLGPINRNDAATTPGEAQISIKRLDPVAAGFLDPSDGLSFLADLDARAASDGQTLASSGTVHIEDLKLRKGAAAAPKRLDLAYSVTHRLKDNSGEIADASATIGNSAIHVSGTYQPIASKALGTTGVLDTLLDLKLSGQSLPIDDLQSLMTAAAIRLPNGSTLKGGALSLNFAVKGQPNALVITGAVALDNTRLVGFDVGSKIHGVAALSGVKTGDTTEFQKLHADLRISNSGVVVNNIDAVIPAMGELTGSGTVSPADQLDFNLAVKGASAKGIGKVGVGFISLLNGSSGTVPLRVTGTSEEPYITANVGGLVQKKTRSITSIFGKKN